MKKFIFVLSLLSVTIDFFAQSNATAEWSPITKISKADIIGDIVAMVDGDIYLSTYTQRSFSINQDYQINRYDALTMEKKAEPLEFASKAKDRYLEDSFSFSNRLFFLNSSIGRKTSNLYLKSADLENLKWNNDELEIFSHETVIKLTDMTDVRYKRRLSDDRSKLMIVYERHTPKQNMTLGFMVLNQNLENILEDHVELTVPRAEYRLLDWLVTDEGDVYLLGKTLRELWKPGIDRELELMKFSVDGSAAISKSVRATGKSLSDGKLSVSSDGQVTVVGYHSTQKSQNIKGSFFARLNPSTLDTEQIKTHDFSFDMLTAHFSDKDLRKAKRHYQNQKLSGRFQYTLDFIKMRSDGGYFLVGEQDYAVLKTYKALVSSYSGYGTRLETSTAVMDPSDDILVASFSAEGEMLWSTRIARSMNGTGGRLDWSHYTYMIKDDQLKLLYNDHVKNVAPFEGKPTYLFKPGKSTMVVNSFDEKGEQTRESILPFMGLGIDPWIAAFSLSDEIFFLGHFSKKIGFLKVGL